MNDSVRVSFSYNCLSLNNRIIIVLISGSSSSKYNSNSSCSSGLLRTLSIE